MPGCCVCMTSVRVCVTATTVRHPRCSQIVRFSNVLRGVFANPGSDPLSLKLAAKALGHLARVGGSMSGDFVGYEARADAHARRRARPRGEWRAVVTCARPHR